MNDFKIWIGKSIVFLIRCLIKLLELLGISRKDISDGYHTFGELYHHRAMLFLRICKDHPEISWKSKKHSDGTMFPGDFIVGIRTPMGMAAYHYSIDPYWDLFDVKELEFAPEYDGYTPEESLQRILSVVPSTSCNKCMWFGTKPTYCSNCIRNESRDLFIEHPFRNKED